MNEGEKQQSQKTYDDFHGKKETRSGFESVPAEDALVYDINAGMHAVQFFLLCLDQVSTDLDDGITRPFIYIRVFVADIVENVTRQSTVPSADLVYDEIFIWKVLEEVL